MLSTLFTKDCGSIHHHLSVHVSPSSPKDGISLQRNHLINLKCNATSRTPYPSLENYSSFSFPMKAQTKSNGTMKLWDHAPTTRVAHTRSIDSFLSNRPSTFPPTLVSAQDTRAQSITRFLHPSSLTPHLHSSASCTRVNACVLALSVLAPLPYLSVLAPLPYLPVLAPLHPPPPFSMTWNNAEGGTCLQQARG